MIRWEASREMVEELSPVASAYKMRAERLALGCT